MLIWSTAVEEKWGVLLGMLASILWTTGRVTVPLMVQLGLDRGVRQDGPLLNWVLVILAAGALFAGIGFQHLFIGADQTGFWRASLVTHEATHHGGIRRAHRADR